MINFGYIDTRLFMFGNYLWQLLSWNVINMSLQLVCSVASGLSDSVWRKKVAAAALRRKNEQSGITGVIFSRILVPTERKVVVKTRGSTSEE